MIENRGLQLRTWCCMVLFSGSLCLGCAPVVLSTVRKLAFALAGEGHRVDPVGVSPDLIRAAAGKDHALLASIGVGNALGGVVLRNDSYDAVLLSGEGNSIRLARREGGLVFLHFCQSGGASEGHYGARSSRGLVEKRDLSKAKIR